MMQNMKIAYKYLKLFNNIWIIIKENFNKAISVFRVLGKYLKLLYIYFKISLITAMEYRVNFILGGLFETFWYSMNIVFFNVIFTKTDSIGGWNLNEVLLLVFFCALIDNMFGFLFWGGITEIPNLIKEGTLDFILLKPISNRFQMSIKRMNCSQLYNLIFGMIGIVYIVTISKIELNFIKIIVALLLAINGLFIIYNFYFLLFTICFWVIEASSLRKFSQDVFTIGNKPIDIYPRIIQKFFTYIIPFGVAFSYPVKYLIQKLDILSILQAFLISFSFFYVTEIIYKAALKNYSSASS